MLKVLSQQHCTHALNCVCAVLPKVLNSVLAAMPVRFMLRAKRMSTQHKTLMTSALFALTFTLPTIAATPFGSVINNTASASYQVLGVPLTSSGSANITITGRSPGKIEFLQYDPNAAGTNSADVQVGTTTCGATTLAAPSYPPATVLTIPGVIRLAPATIYNNGDPIFIRVTDLDQNKNPLVAETITTTITTPLGDSETITLTETGLSTGVFVGYIQSNNVAVAGDCKLNVASNEKISTSYTDALDAIKTVSATALVDPFGVLFDSVTGAPVNNATVTLIDNATGLPATVLCDNGTTTLSNPVVSGSNTVCDATMVAGGYRFPRVAPGTYRLQIVPSTGYAFVSTKPIASLPAGFVIIGPIGSGLTAGASYGGNFTLNPSPAVKIDVPLDPSNTTGGLLITKITAKNIVAIGDFVPYSITITNSAAGAATNVIIADTLPIGFRYIKNSAKLDAIALAATNPAITADGRTLSFNLGNMAASATITLKYVASVTAGAKIGLAENTAQSTSHNSNTGRASVTVREDLYQQKSLLVGRVIVGSCDGKIENDLVGLQNARILLEDGTYITTDKDGRWHADNIRPGTHVVQLDKDSLPAGYEVMTCEVNSRFAGRNYSQFVNIQGGTLWRADFYVKKIAENNVAESNAETKKDGSKKGNIKPETLPANDDAKPSKDVAKQQALSLVEKLPYDGAWLASTSAGVEWLHPQANFQPALPVVKVAVKHAPDQVVSVKINGEKVSPLNFDGALQNAARTVKLSTWSSVPLKSGENTLSVVIVDKTGKVIFEETRTIHYGVTPVRAVLDEKRSHLMADGKTNPVIAVRFLDDAGKPVRRGVAGEFEVNAPYQTLDQFEAIQREPLAGKLGGKSRYVIGEDGVALIELMPTTQTGEAVLNFTLGSFESIENKAQKEVRAWLMPGQRDWVLVGFAEGTIGHKKLSGNMTALKDSGVADQLFDQDRIAFYAKGTIKGEYLLTMAYDTAKERGQGTNNLKQAIDPNQYYTLYADAAQPQFDAASARKLYLKIEKNKFYAMFGDYDTGLTVTELSRYSRTLNGVKSEFKGKIRGKEVSYNAFATNSAQAFKKDEIRGDGTSGLYRLTSGNIVVNSDKVRVETRDRFHNEVILNTENFTRYIDYDIDTNLGTLFFHQPIQSRDANLNPTYIVAEYESNDTKTDEKMSYGGRAAFKPNEKTEIGVSHIHEGNTGNSGNLTGVDATYNASDKTKIRVELANSNHENNLTSNATSNVTTNDNANSGNAWLVEATHQDAKYTAKAYAREQQAGFGLSQQSAGEAGTRKMGVDGNYKINDQTQLQAQAYRQEVLTTGAERDLADARVQWQKDAVTANVGLRLAQDKNLTTSSTGGDTGTQSSKQLTTGVSYAFLDKKLILRANTETSLDGGASSSDFPNRYRIGADYKLNPKTTLFAEHEIAHGANLKAETSRVGLRATPWQGGEMTTALGDQIQQDGNRLFASLGLIQKWQINEHWQADAGFDRSQTISNTASQLNTNVPLASGGGLNGVGINNSDSYSSTGFNNGLTTSDYTATSLGAHYNNKVWSANSRVEYRTSSTEDKINLLAGVQRNLDNGRTVAAGISYSDVNGESAKNSNIDARLSAAYRPNGSRWIWLDRIDYIDDKSSNAQSNINTKKLINNFNANYMPNRKTQLAMQYGAKYVLDSIDNEDYSGYTDLLGAELRYDIDAKWDLGVRGDMLRTWKSGQKSFAYGASLGYNLMENTWVSVGYNLKGFADSDFSGAEFRTKGLYFNFRMKFDQDTFGLNMNKNTKLPKFNN
ncbi:MAG: hypothetical protein WBP13_03700 [Methylophilaceae bacterium]